MLPVLRGAGVRPRWGRPHAPRTPPRPGRLKAWREVEEHAYEGLVERDASVPYVNGRSLAWLKVPRPESRARLAKRFGGE